jgi:predicted nucleic acid-binding protein
MSLFVVDSSVGIKWFIPEIHAAHAFRLQDPAHDLHAPTFFDVEIGNILWKKSRKSELSRRDAEDIISQLPHSPLKRHPESPLIGSAFDLADRTQRTVYDCLYLALAVQLGGQMVTADLRLFNSLSTTPWAGHICWVENVP